VSILNQTTRQHIKNMNTDTAMIRDVVEFCVPRRWLDSINNTEQCNKLH